MKKETGSVLKMRAIEMAKKPVQASEVSVMTNIIVFTLATERYGIESSFVREVFSLKDFTPLPGVPSYITGIVNVHGRILPIVDLKIFFNLPEKGLGELNKLIIIRDEQMEFGVLADTVDGTELVSIGKMLPVPPTVTGIGQKYLMGLTKDHLIVLSAEKLLSDKSIIVNDIVTN